MSSAGVEAVEVAALAGLNLDPWEQFVLVHALGEDERGRWAAFEVGLAAPRQNGKGSILEARELAGAFAFGERLLIHSAHEQLTSSEHFRRLLNLIEGVPEFEQRVLKVVRGKGSEAIELRDGQRILFKTRTGGGGRGLTGDFVALDEAMILPVATTAALVPTMAARSITGNPQLMYSGSAVDQEKHEHGVVFARVRERGMRQDPRVAWFEWSVAGDDPSRVPDEVRTDPGAWGQANPGMGIRISRDHIANECAGALGPREFAVERLGVGDWPDTSDDAGRIIPVDVWKRLAEHDQRNRIVDREFFAIDADPNETWASICVAGVREDGDWQVAVADHRRGVDWLVGRLGELTNRVVIDVRGPAAVLLDRLDESSIDVVRADTEDYANAASAFVNEALAGSLRYPSPQPELSDAVGNARWGAMGDRRKWKRRSPDGSTICPLVAGALALWGAQSQGAPQVWSLAEIAATLQADTTPEPVVARSGFIPLGAMPHHH